MLLLGLKESQRSWEVLGCCYYVLVREARQIIKWEQGTCMISLKHLETEVEWIYRRVPETVHSISHYTERGRVFTCLKKELLYYARL